MERLDPRWRKATYSGNGGADCVETGSVPGAVLTVTQRTASTA